VDEKCLRVHSGVELIKLLPELIKQLLVSSVARIRAN
jgi:hypothetical protein